MWFRCLHVRVTGFGFSSDSGFVITANRPCFYLLSSCPLFLMPFVSCFPSWLGWGVGKVLYGIGSIEPGHVGYGFRVNMTPRAHHQTGKLESRLYQVSSAYLRDADLTIPTAFQIAGKGRLPFTSSMAFRMDLATQVSRNFFVILAHSRWSDFDIL